MKTSINKTMKQIIKTLFEVNKAYSIMMGDTPQGNFEDISDEKTLSIINGIEAVFRNPEITPKELHQNWCNFKIAQGYKHGYKKSESEKTHPSLIEYTRLHQYEQNKDFLFIQTVKSFF